MDRKTVKNGHHFDHINRAHSSITQLWVNQFRSLNARLWVACILPRKLRHSKTHFFPSIVGRQPPYSWLHLLAYLTDTSFAVLNRGPHCMRRWCRSRATQEMQRPHRQVDLSCHDVPTAAWHYCTNSSMVPHLAKDLHGMSTRKRTSQITPRNPVWENIGRRKDAVISLKASEEPCDNQISPQGPTNTSHG